jgi:hypothetical protein
MSSRSEDAALAAPTTTEVSGSTSERTRVLRGRIAPEQGYVEKKRRALRCPETDFTHITPAISDAIFFKLPRELRDSVYQFLWVDMRIWQRYKKNFFILTYGDQGDMDSEENSTYGKVGSVVYRNLSFTDDPRHSGAMAAELQADASRRPSRVPPTVGVDLRVVGQE